MKTLVLTANLGNFDTEVAMVPQNTNRSEVEFRRLTDSNFPPIAGLTPRMQYRIPKLFGWKMFPGYDNYIWIDGCMQLLHPDSVNFFLEQLGNADMAFFKHPQRNSVVEEVMYIEEKLMQQNKYIVDRYNNGLHGEALQEFSKDERFRDNVLYTSTAFVYRNNIRVREMMEEWWYYQSRYFTCDQVSLPYAIHRAGLKVNKIDMNQYKIPYLTLISKH